LITQRTLFAITEFVFNTHEIPEFRGPRLKWRQILHILLQGPQVHPTSSSPDLALRQDLHGVLERELLALDLGEVYEEIPSLTELHVPGAGEGGAPRIFLDRLAEWEHAGELLSEVAEVSLVVVSLHGGPPGPGIDLIEALDPGESFVRPLASRLVTPASIL
jgi:hypothetical protein